MRERSHRRYLRRVMDKRIDGRRFVNATWKRNRLNWPDERETVNSDSEPGHTDCRTSIDRRRDYVNVWPIIIHSQNNFSVSLFDFTSSKKLTVCYYWYIKDHSPCQLPMYRGLFRSTVIRKLYTYNYIRSKRLTRHHWSIERINHACDHEKYILSYIILLWLT